MVSVRTGGKPLDPPYLALVFFPLAGFSYACADPGYFRVTFCIRRKELEIALERIETVCGLPHKAVEISRSCPE